MELSMDVHTAREVAVGSIAPSDEIVLVTGQSTYRFVLQDAAERRGLLHGGKTATGQTAYFCGTLDGPASFRPSTIRPGARALFLLEEGSDRAQCRRFLTSKLVEVRVIRRHER